MTLQTQNKPGYENNSHTLDIDYFCDEDYRGISIAYGQMVEGDRIVYFATSSRSPFFFSGANLKEVRTSAVKAIDSYRDYEEKDWLN